MGDILRKAVLSIGIVLLAIITLMEGCSPPEALKVTSFSFSSKDICEVAPASPTNKLTQLDASSASSPFSKSKVYLLEEPLLVKSQAHKTSEYEVTVLTHCSSNSQVYEKIMSSVDPHLLTLPKVSLSYIVTDQESLPSFLNAVEEDDCIIGVTNKGETQTANSSNSDTAYNASLFFNDPNVYYQEYLEITNYAHAAQYLVSPFELPQVTSAFIDTGVDCNHSDLQGQLISTCGTNMVQLGELPQDVDGHGTHTLGLVSAKAGNYRGISGLVSKNHKSMAIKVIHQGTGSAAAAANGIQLAIQQNVDVINISLESREQLVTVEDAVIDAINAGIFVVMAAGNHSKLLNDEIHVSPASVGSDFEGALSVGSYDIESRRVSYFSNLGSGVEIYAPGSVSTTGNDDIGLFSLAPNNGFTRLQGTSQAAPIVTAAALLAIQFLKHHNLNSSPREVERILKASTDRQSFLPFAPNYLNFSKLTRNLYQEANKPLCNN